MIKFLPCIKLTLKILVAWLLFYFYIITSSHIDTISMYGFIAVTICIIPLGYFLIKGIDKICTNYQNNLISKQNQLIKAIEAQESTFGEYETKTDLFKRLFGVDINS